MNTEHRGILYGLVLGDGHISIRQRLGKDKHGTPKYEYTNCELVFAHSPKQKEYIEHKRELLVSVLGGAHPKISTVKSKLSNGKTYPGLRLAKSDTYFRQMHRVIYPTGKKVFSDTVLDYLTAHSLALWYMDDGSMRCNRNRHGAISSCFADLTTHCSEEEAVRIVRWLGEKWGIDAKVRPDAPRGVFNIGFNTRGCHQLADVIWPYIIPSMQYKFQYLEDFEARTSARDPTEPKKRFDLFNWREGL